uniref:Uncharacterized protein n=1 Tax=uncultured Muribaculaceae bacterium TaxID=2301481 RepID=A0A6G8F3L6_9BACT|nr:hypothetical protein Muribac1_0890 [uncultured Muribaculaceae bacterium]
MIQTVSAERKVDIAYTSDSTAENQVESQKAKQRAPPAAVMAAMMSVSAENNLLLRLMESAHHFTNVKIMLESRNAARAMKTPLKRFITNAWLSWGKGAVATLMASIQKGFPGGCPISRRDAHVAYSGQSQ